MIRTLRSLFLSRPLREKLLVAGIAAAIFALWFSSFATRAARAVHTARATTSVLADQSLWLSNRAAIDAKAQAAASHLDAARTLDATRLLAEVSAIAGETGLTSTTSGESKDERSGQFAVHTLQFNVSKVDWNTLKGFYLALGKHSPYIGIIQFSVQGDRANPALLNASFRLSSVEISKN